MYKTLKKLYVFLFARKSFYIFNRLLYKLSLSGLGILNHENDYVSGEKNFIEQLIQQNKLTSGVVLDIGANIGNYSIMLRQHKISLPLFSFEPNQDSYNTLAQNAELYKFTSIKKGMGAQTGQAKMYDYASENSTEHASMYRDVIEQIHKSVAREIDIQLTTVDEFVAQNNIDEIALLKIDTEGNELNVLKGASQSIEKGLINIIQIEFNEMNVVSRSFMKDIVDMLPSYNFYRLLPGGMLPLGNYQALYFEIFAFQNLIALKKTA